MPCRNLLGMTGAFLKTTEFELDMITKSQGQAVNALPKRRKFIDNRFRDGVIKISC